MLPLDGTRGNQEVSLKTILSHSLPKSSARTLIRPVLLLSELDNNALPSGPEITLISGQRYHQASRSEIGSDNPLFATVIWKRAGCTDIKRITSQ